MATDIEICSRALMLVGDDPISSFSDRSDRARTCATLYPMARRDMLRQHLWNCAIKRVLLPSLTGAPAYGWAHWFAKPGDWLRVIDVGDCGDDDYAFEGNRILSNQTTLKLRYVANVSEGYWDDSLTDVMVRRMAADLAYPITKSAALQQTMEQKFERQLRIAKNIDGQENPPEKLGDSPFIAVRQGGY